ncbi:MAG: ABC transporter ATP-binding protein [Spirochaetales bacterium]|nr:ABC transporter ATP-binding protein [Spirochaetales bacterium]
MKDMIRIMGFLKPYAGRMAAALVLLLLSSGVMLVQPRLTQWAVDSGITAGSVRTVILASLAVLLSAAAGSVLMYSSGILLIRASQGAGYDMRNRLFTQVSSFSFANFDRFRTGELMVRLNSDVNMVVMFFRMGLFMMIQAIFFLVGAVVLMFVTAPRMAAVVAAVMAGIFVVFLLFSRVIRPLFLKVREALDRLNNTLQENLAGAKLVRAFSRQVLEKEKFGSRNHEFYALSLKVGVFIGIAMPFLMLVGNLALLLVLRMGGAAVGGVGIGAAPAGASGPTAMTLGELTAFSNYAMMAVFPIVMLAMVLNFLIMASASAARIAEVLATSPGLAELPGAVSLEELRGAIAFENVSFRYGEGEEALSGIDLEIRPGERIGLIGTTGSGKSTLAALICRFYDASGGIVRLDGRDVRALSFDTVRGRTVLVLQETVLFSGTIAENIRFGRPEATTEEVHEAARLACAEEFILEKEKQWEEPVGERGMGLSGGQRQRVAIARAILARPDILILDDVTSALDLRTESRIIDNLYGLPDRRTTIVISQKISAVRRADRIVVLDGGRIQAVGAHEELLGTSGIYREIHETQNAEASQAEAGA